MRCAVCMKRSVLTQLTSVSSTQKSNPDRIEFTHGCSQRNSPGEAGRTRVRCMSCLDRHGFCLHCRRSNHGPPNRRPPGPCHGGGGGSARPRPPAGSVLGHSAHGKCGVHLICSLEEGSNDTRACIVAREKAFVCMSGVWPSQKILAGEWPVRIGSRFQPGTLVSE